MRLLASLALILGLIGCSLQDKASQPASRKLSHALPSTETIGDGTWRVTAINGAPPSSLPNEILLHVDGESLLPATQPITASVGYHGVMIDQMIGESQAIAHPHMLYIPTADGVVFRGMVGLESFSLSLNHHPDLVSRSVLKRGKAIFLKAEC